MNAYHVDEGYNKDGDFIPRRYTATLAEARKIKSSYITIPNIEKVKLDISKASILRMINNEGNYEISADEVV